MIDNKDEQFPVVDEMGNILGAISRGHAHDGCKILHPVVHLHLFNNKGDLFLQHRPAWKDIQPDKWDTAYSQRHNVPWILVQSRLFQVRMNWMEADSGQRRKYSKIWVKKCLLRILRMNTRSISCNRVYDIIIELFRYYPNLVLSSIK